MSELSIMWTTFAGAIGMCVGCLLYSMGGRDEFEKAVRRYAGSAVLAVSVLVPFIVMGRFSWWFLFIYPMTIGVFVLPYGADRFWTKVEKRSLVVLASLMTSILMCVILGGRAWLVLPAEIAVASVTVYLGVKNPVHAATEEFMICMFLWMPKLMYPFT